LGRPPKEKTHKGEKTPFGPRLWIEPDICGELASSPSHRGGNRPSLGGERRTNGGELLSGGGKALSRPRWRVVDYKPGRTRPSEQRRHYLARSCL